MKPMYALLFSLITCISFSQGQTSDDSYTRYELLDPVS